MLRLLLQAAAGIATFNVGRRIAEIRRSAAYFAVAGLFGLLGLGALTAAAIIYLSTKLEPAAAAAAVGCGLIALAGLVVWVGAWKAKPKPPTPIFERVRAEVGAAGAAVASSRAARKTRDATAELRGDPEEGFEPPPPLSAGQKRKRAINLVLIATIAGVVLGRRL